jgi:hypothetical protein
LDQVRCLQELTVRLRTAALLIVPILAGWASPAAAQRFFPPYYPPYAYPYYRYAGPESEVRVEVKPKNAMVYVDGYYAGQVDDFDGAFQRLHVSPGSHDIVIYLQGYRSLHEKLYVGPNTTRKISARLEPLPAGQPNDPVPVPPEPPDEVNGARPPMTRGGPGRYPPPPPFRGRGDGRPPAPPAGEPSATSGSIVIHVQPVADEILVDGTHWDAPTTTDQRLVIQVGPGHHVIEVRKSGYRTARTEVDVRPGDSVPINVSLMTDLAPVH